MSLEKAVKNIKRWKNNPLQFVSECLKVTPDRWQEKALQSYQDPSKMRVAMKASKGVGKTSLLAWCIWHFISCFGEKGSHPKGAATSITEDNINDNLWPELSKWQARSEYLSQCFTWRKERIFANDHPETWFFSRRTWPKSADSQRQADTLAGLHADYLMFVLDESGGIPDAVMAAAEAGLATVKWGRILQAGNPTNLEGPLYRACTSERHLWNVITINSDPDNPERSPRVNIEWAKQQIEKYGRDNPWVQVNVFGEFPKESLNTLLSVDEVERAMHTRVAEKDYYYSQKRLGIDVARFGSDATVIYPRQGLVAFEKVEMRNARTNDIAARIALAKQRWNSELEFIDDTGGFGAGVIDACLQAGINAIGVNFSGKPVDPRYFNKRSEIWFELADWIKRGGSIPEDPDLVKELTTPTYTFHNGKFRLEEKDQIKERLGYSPDSADALCLTFAMPDVPANNPENIFLGTKMGSMHVSDWNPLDRDRK